MVSKNMVAVFEAFQDISFEKFLEKYPDEKIRVLSPSQVWAEYQKERGKLS